MATGSNVMQRFRTQAKEICRGSPSWDRHEIYIEGLDMAKHRLLS
jgi:hypothetical protein